jgi:hypothetical protein
MMNRAAAIGVGLNLAFMSVAMAQGTWPTGPMQAAPMQPAPMQASPLGPPGGGQPPPCMNDFVPLRAEAEKRAGFIKAAAARKASREEICQLITKFSEAEGKFAKFVVANASWCGIPPQVATQIQANHAKTMKTRTQVCSGGGPMGAQGPQIPPGPGLADAIGVGGRAPNASNTTTNKGGTYDTLTGNPIK